MYAKIRVALGVCFSILYDKFDSLMIRIRFVLTTPVFNAGAYLASTPVNQFSIRPSKVV